MNKRFVLRIFLLSLFLIPIFSLAAQPTANLIIYDDTLASNWQNWSWNTTVSFNASSPVHAGNSAMSVTHNAAWAGLALQSSSTYSTADYNAVTFWIHGGSTGGHQLSLKLRDGSQTILDTAVAVTTTANSWTKVEVSLSALGLSNGTVTGIVLQETSGSAQPVYYLDDVQLVEADGSGTPVPPGSGPTLTINTTAVSHTISPDIYGMNFANTTLAAEIGLPVNRWGGNATTRYNWKFDVSNRASDWFFMNVPEGDNDLTVNTVDEIVMANNSTGTRSIVTMPLIGWTPKRRLINARDCGFPGSVYPNQQAFDGNWNCGNGRFPSGTPITGNDPTLTSLPIDETWVNEWVTHLTNTFGTAANGGITYYSLDNEPMLWNHTHRDVHPDPVTYDELVARSLAYAAAIKQADPTAKTLGPVLWGWTAYFYSAADVASSDTFWLNPPDRLAHDNKPLVEWYLQQLAAYEQTHGTRLLDYLDLHFYPQANGVALSSAGGDATQALRLRSTRALWDPTYVDESWINEPVYLIPRMHDWVNKYYPGTKIAITEYNWGGLEHINGALAQADVLGIFGQQQVDLATLWAPPANNAPGAFAFRMYLNYDGSGASFGNLSLPASSSNTEQLSVFAARRSSDFAITIMVVNKSGQPLTSAITMEGFTGGTAEVYRYASSNLSQITQQPNVVVPAGSFSATFPANSITLFEVAGGDIHQSFVPLVNK